MRKITLFVVLALGVVLASVSVEAASTDVDLTAKDGTVLKATYMSPGRPGPAMLLIHQCNMDRTSWSGIATELVDAGVHVLTLDLRGFGDSEGDGMRGPGGFASFLETSHADVDMAYAYLLSQSGVDQARVGAGGASCGAMLTAELASRQPALKALMLLSGPPSDQAVAHMAASSSLAVFAAAATEDAVTPGVAKTLQRAVEGSSHARSVSKIYSGTEHGLPMFSKNADLEAALTGWLKNELLSGR